MIKKYCSYLCLFLVNSLFSQTINGIVVDKTTQEPLIGASVYFDGTTIGTITDENGAFTLETEKKITAPFIISYIGYTDVVLQLGDQLEGLKISLSPKAVSLNEVVLRADPFTREQKLKAFKLQFLGQTVAGKSCKILNEDAIYVGYDVSKKELIASADEPILIENPHLGYQLQFRLESCTLKYYSKSINPFDLQSTFYSGTCFFIDKQKGNKKSEKRRLKSYLGSIMHLMRSSLVQNWKKEGFTFYDGKYPTNPSIHFSFSDTLGLKKVTLPKRLSILYKKKKQSAIFPKYKYYFIDGYGNFYPPDAVSFSGAMGEKRVGDLLPLDYKPE